jgi:methyl-accepting chemotaxis protein
MFGLAIVAVFWIGLAFLLSVERDKTIGDAIQLGNNLARLFEENTVRLFKGVDRSLLLLRLAYEENPERFDLRHWVQQTTLVGDQTMQLSMIGPDGFVKIITSSYAGPPIYVGDREHFQFLSKTKSDELYISKPTASRASGQMSIFAARKLRQPDGSFGGLIVASVDPEFIEKFYHSINLGTQDGIILRGLDGVIRASYGFSASNLDKNSMPKVLSEALARASAGYFWDGGAHDGINRLISYRTVDGYPLLVKLARAEHEIFADHERRKTTYLAVAAVLTLLVLIFVVASFRRQLSLEQTNFRFNTALENMTHGLCMFDGNKRLVICNKRYADLYRLPPELLKIGTTHEAIITHRVKNGILAGEKNTGAVDKKLNSLGQLSSNEVSIRVDELADGRMIRIIRQPMKEGGWVATHQDVSERLKLEKQRDDMLMQENRRALTDAAIASFRMQIEEVLGVVSNNAHTMKSTAAALLGSSDQTTHHAEGALRESNEASANVAKVAGSAEELSNSIAEINQQLDQTKSIVANAVDKAKATNDRYAGLAQAAQKIGDVIKLIRNIAGQTNLLALNATIEAARAGEAGRGFAVVASEVKSLAVQTAQATEDIARHILAVQESTGSAVEAVHGIEASMHEISLRTSSAAASILQQNAATSEITGHAVNAARGTSMVVSVLGHVSEAAINTHTAAQTMLTASNLVDSSVGNLRTEIEDFLRKVAV